MTTQQTQQPAGDAGDGASVPLAQGGATPEGNAAPPPAAPPPEVPAAKPAEAAPLTVKWAEGLRLPEAAKAKYLEAAKQHGMTPAQAQAAADFYAQLQSEGTAADVAAAKAELRGWEKAIADDKEMGGAALADTRKHVEAGVLRFASPGLQKLLRDTGFGAHPEVVRHFRALGALSKEDTVAGAKAAATQASKEEARMRALFPTHFK